MIALAIVYISASVPLYLNILTAVKTNRQLFCVYPLSLSTRSMLGEKEVLPLEFRINSMFVTSHRPFHRALHHSNVRSKSLPSLSALCLIPERMGIHG